MFLLNKPNGIDGSTANNWHITNNEDTLCIHVVSFNNSNDQLSKDLAWKINCILNIYESKDYDQILTELTYVLHKIKEDKNKTKLIC